jgi:hypothetical protein
MKSSILNPVRATIVAATLVITLSAACWAREQNQTDVRLDETSILDRDVVLTAQVAAPWCYTSYGPFPMRVALPPGAFCQVNIPFYPFVLNGVTGY